MRFCTVLYDCLKNLFTFDQSFSQKNKIMAPRTEEQFQQIRKEKRGLIMSTALELFAKNGFNATSISMIAKEAGISKGLMYNYFKSKDELLYSIIMNGMETFMHFLVVKDENNIRKEEIIGFIDGNLESLKVNTDYYRLYFSLAFQADIFDKVQPVFLPAFETIIKLFTNYFAGQGHKDAYAKARFILALFDGVGIHYIADKEHFPLDRVRNMIIEML